nr:hypothetical protein GCM10020093_062810 [Planobispora longispora]
MLRSAGTASPANPLGPANPLDPVNPLDPAGSRRSPVLGDPVSPAGRGVAGSAAGDWAALCSRMAARTSEAEISAVAAASASPAATEPAGGDAEGPPRAAGPAGLAGRARRERRGRRL